MQSVVVSASIVYFDISISSVLLLRGLTAGGLGKVECAECLVLLTLLLALTLHGLGTDLLVVLLEGSKVLATLGELTLLHTLTDVPVHEGALGVHEVELVVHAGEDLGHGGGVGDHAAGALHLSEATTGHHGGWLVVDPALEASGAPVDELDGALGLDGGDGSVHVLGDDVTAVHHAAG